MAKVSLSTKIHIPLIGSLVLGLIIILGISWNGINEIKPVIHQNEKSKIKDMMNEKIHAKYFATLTNAITLGHNGDVGTALRFNDIAFVGATLKNLTNDFKQNSDFKNVKIHVHTKDGFSFLRHWSDKRGDDLKSFRKTIRKVMNDKKPFVALEVGRDGLAFRGISPVIDDGGTYQGSIEFMAGFASVLKDLKVEDGIDSVLLLSSKYKDLSENFKQNVSIGNYMIINKSESANDKLLSEIKPEFIEKDYAVSDNYFMTSTPLKDIDGEIIGYLLGIE
ncbi:MAG: hypothetical protein HXX81_04300, partial [Campylobacterales bacterium]|nr:hypothetical protein [Campylobacterales bacterium]